ncbi:MAG: CYTH domain-containing protein [Nitriliruptoraceae bacterium]
MGREIERKFLVTGDGWREQATGPSHIVQGYLHVEDDAEIRVRIRDDEAVLTVKRGGARIDRMEVEVPLERSSAQTLLDEAVVGLLVTKQRFQVPVGDGLVAEVDVFAPPHDGLVLAEVELPDVEAELPELAWIGTEVTGDRRYYNSTLASRADDRG